MDKVSLSEVHEVYYVYGMTEDEKWNHKQDMFKKGWFLYSEDEYRITYTLNINEKVKYKSEVIKIN